MNLLKKILGISDHPISSPIDPDLLVATRLRKMQVTALGYIGRADTGLPALTPAQHAALLILERTSPHTPLETNVRLAKLKPVTTERNFHLDRRPLADIVSERLREDARRGSVE